MKYNPQPGDVIRQDTKIGTKSFPWLLKCNEIGEVSYIRDKNGKCIYHPFSVDDTDDIQKETIYTSSSLARILFMNGKFDFDEETLNYILKKEEEQLVGMQTRLRFHLTTFQGYVTRTQNRIRNLQHNDNQSCAFKEQIELRNFVLEVLPNLDEMRFQCDEYCKEIMLFKAKILESKTQ